MSRSPYVRGDPFWDFFAQPDRFFDSHFGHTLTEEDFFPPSYYRRVAPRQFGVPRSPMMMDSLMHPLAAQQQQQQQQQSQQQVQQQQQQQQQVQVQAPQQGDKYSIMVDVSQFTPEEISVKTIDNTIIVIGKHEDKADNFGYVSRQFSRKYLLPSDVVPETVTSTLSADGILSIQAPRKPLMIKDTEVGRAVPIALSTQCISPAAQHVAPPQFPQPTVAPVTAPVAQPIPVSVEQSTAPAAPAAETVEQ